MKKMLVLVIVSLFLQLSYAQHYRRNESVRKQIYLTEKAFEKMVLEKGIPEAFSYYADQDAVIVRGNDSIIKGKSNIREYYERKTNKSDSIHWTPDVIKVSDDGTMAYTYGKYVRKIKNMDGSVTEYKGIFHTVWKKQSDKTWKYVWD